MQGLMEKRQTETVAQIRSAIAARMDSVCFSSWIMPLEFKIVGRTLFLLAPNQFSADFIESVHGKVLSSVSASFGLVPKLCVKGFSQKRSAVIANDNTVQSFSSSAGSPAKNVSSEAFDRFVSSDENAFVLSACRKVAAGKVSFSPFFIYGPSGCGKTLLVDSIESASQGRTIKMAGTQFISEFTRSLRDKTIFAFKDFCRNCDTFIMDDVQALSGKPATCEEFVQLILDLLRAGTNIILTADSAPGELSGFGRDVQSLLASGLVADIVPPNFYVRKQILLNSGIGGEVASELAARLSSNGHLVSGVAVKIKTYCELMGEKIDISIAERLLSDTLEKFKTPIQVIKSICGKLGVSYDALCSKSRASALVLARQTIAAVLKGATNMSLSEIGCFLGGRTHSTILYSLSKIKRLKSSDLLLASQISQLISEYKQF